MVSNNFFWSRATYPIYKIDQEPGNRVLKDGPERGFVLEKLMRILERKCFLIMFQFYSNNIYNQKDVIKMNFGTKKLQ